MRFDPRTLLSHINRRTFLRRSGVGLGAAALGSLLSPELLRAVTVTPPGKSTGNWAGVIRPPHLPVKAKRVIHLCMAGGPSQFESLDYKPPLKELHGKPFPESFTKGQQLAQLQGAELKARGPFCEFTKCGKSGLDVSTLFP